MSSSSAWGRDSTSALEVAKLFGDNNNSNHNNNTTTEAEVEPVVTVAGSASSSSSPPPVDGDAHSGISPAQLECLAAVAFLVGCPLQRGQPSALESVHPAMRVAMELISRGVDVERVVSLIESQAFLTA